MTLIIAGQGHRSFIAADRRITSGNIKEEARKIRPLTLKCGHKGSCIMRMDEDFPRTDLRAEMQELGKACAQAYAEHYARERWSGKVIEADIRYAGTLPRGSFIHPDKLEGGPDPEGRYWRWVVAGRTLPDGQELEPLIFQAKFRLHPLPNMDNLWPPTNPFCEHYERQESAYLRARSILRDNGVVVWAE